VANEVDHFFEAPPQVVADTRHKVQKHESLLQPSKKDRRFIHQSNVTEKEGKRSVEWELLTLNP
jgi:hypothetical protein